MIATEGQRALAKELPVVCLREDTAGARESPQTSGREAKVGVCDYKGGLEDWTAAERLRPVDVRTFVRRGSL